MNQLADSVLELSNEAILAEVREAEADPEQEAECTRFVLCKASAALENVNRRLSNLGHTIKPNAWRRGQSGYHNNCLCCGRWVSLTMDGEVQGSALNRSCHQSVQYTVARCEASLK
jgi:hypothetical protein